MVFKYRYKSHMMSSSFTPLKLSCVLTSTNNNELYCDFIPHFIKSWKYLFPDIIVKIIFIGDIPDKFKEYKEYLISFPEINGVNSAFISQNIRLLYPGILSKINGGILISDIDMIPMNRSFYLDPLKGVDENTFYTYYDNLIDYQEIRICYCIATSELWKKVMWDKGDISSILSSWYKSINEYKPPKGDGLNTGGINWNFDQKMLYQRVHEYGGSKGGSVIFGKGENHSQLDRSGFTLNSNMISEIITGKYSEYHMLRPNSLHHKMNDFIIDLLLFGKRLQELTLNTMYSKLSPIEMIKVNGMIFEFGYSENSSNMIYKWYKKRKNGNEMSFLTIDTNIDQINKLREVYQDEQYHKFLYIKNYDEMINKLYNLTMYPEICIIRNVNLIYKLIDKCSYIIMDNCGMDDLEKIGKMTRKHIDYQVPTEFIFPFKYSKLLYPPSPWNTEHGSPTLIISNKKEIDLIFISK